MASSPALAVEPRPAAQPTTASDEKAFAKVMAGTASDVPVEPVPQSDMKEKEDSEKKDANILAAAANVPLPVVTFPVLPLPTLDLTPAVVATGTAAAPETKERNLSSLGSPSKTVTPSGSPSAVLAPAPARDLPVAAEPTPAAKEPIPDKNQATFVAAPQEARRTAPRDDRRASCSRLQPMMQTLPSPLRVASARRTRSNSIKARAR